VLLIGTSLTAGYGLDPDQAWPALIGQRIEAAGLPFRAINAGVSGETSAGALRRIDWLLSEEVPAVVMVETGANDGLRGQDTDSLKANLNALLDRLDRLDPRPIVIVAGMEALPNLGAEYGNRFRALFPAVARDHDALFLPFLLDGVAGNPRFNQADGIHPNVEGSRRVAENVWQLLGPVLDSLATSGY
jgi:acyl-CoA thioesterase-1